VFVTDTENYFLLFLYADYEITLYFVVSGYDNIECTMCILNIGLASSQAITCISAIN